MAAQVSGKQRKELEAKIAKATADALHLLGWLRMALPLLPGEQHLKVSISAGQGIVQVVLAPMLLTSQERIPLSWQSITLADCGCVSVYGVSQERQLRRSRGWS